VHGVQPSVAEVALAEVAYVFASQVMSTQVPSACEYLPIGHANVHAATAPPVEVP